MIVSLMLFPDYGVHSSFIQSIARFECAGKKRSFDTGAKKPFLPLPCHGLIHRLPAVSHNGNGCRVAGFFPGMMPIAFLMVAFLTGSPQCPPRTETSFPPDHRAAFSGLDRNRMVSIIRPMENSRQNAASGSRGASLPRGEATTLPSLFGRYTVMGELSTGHLPLAMFAGSCPSKAR